MLRDRSQRTMRRENPKNKPVTREFIQGTLRSLGLDLCVNDIRVYQTAFIHSSYMKTRHIQERHDPSCVPLHDTCNETYEFAGDTILNSVIGTYLYGRYYDQNEGFLTKTRTKMVRGTTLGQLAKRLGFQEYLVISQHIESTGGRNNLRLLEDLFEAFIGAIYLDNGSEPIPDSWFKAMREYKVLVNDIEQFEEKPEEINITDYITMNKRLRALFSTLISTRSNGYLYCQKFIINAYDKFIDIVKLIAYDDNYKDQLQHYFQSRGTVPTWKTVKEEGKTNNRLHTICVRDRYNKVIGVATARKKAEAEQMASRYALISEGLIKDEPEDFFRN